MNTENFRKEFEKFYCASPDVIVRSPGRVNLIGEHIDYNGGNVMPFAISAEVLLALKKRDDKNCRMASLNFSDKYEGGIPSSKISQPFWCNYFFGAYDEVNKIYPLNSGFDLLIHSSVPEGSGLSSSAAIEVAMAGALFALFGIKTEPLETAKLCQRAENKFVGVNCGLMDQAACACSVKDHALLLDCAKPCFEHVKITNASEISFVIAHSGVPRKLSASEYNQRRGECEKALELINSFSDKIFPELCAVPEEYFNSISGKLPEIIRKRAEHAVTEQSRVIKTAKALNSGDWDEIGSYLNQSHRSLKDNFKVSCSELDILTDIFRNTKGCCGSRLTGAGFGGCTISVVNKNEAERVIDFVKKEYYKKYNLNELIFETSPENGMEVLFKK